MATVCIFRTESESNHITCILHSSKKNISCHKTKVSGWRRLGDLTVGYGRHERVLAQIRSRDVYGAHGTRNTTRVVAARTDLAQLYDHDVTGAALGARSWGGGSGEHWCADCHLIMPKVLWTVYCCQLPIIVIIITHAYT